MAASDRARLEWCSAVDDRDRQMVDIFGAVLTDGLSAVEVACAEALSAELYSSDDRVDRIAAHLDGRHLLSPCLATVLPGDAD